MREEGLACLLQSALLSRIPDGEAECDLVHEIGKVVHQIQSGVLDTAHEISEEITQRVDGPTHCDDETHGAERGSHIFVCAGCCGTCFASEDLKQDEKPSTHAHTEA